MPVNVETFRWSPVGNQSHPVKVSHQPEASLASSSVMAARSVDSECKGRVIEPRNLYYCQSPRYSYMRGQYRPAVGLGRCGMAGVYEHDKCTLGLCWKLGYPVDSTSVVPPGEGNEVLSRYAMHGDKAGREAGSLSTPIVLLESRETKPEEACE